MADAVVRFEREDREGVIAVGSYLIDAYKRFGIRLPEPCHPGSGTHLCQVTVTAGRESLSPLTTLEQEHLSASARKDNVRLACEARIVKTGEIVLMTEEKKSAAPADAEDAKKPKLVAEFEALPLEKKIADLVRMEAVTLGETISFVLNSPYMVFEKIGDVMAEFGMKLEKEAKKASRPAEHETKTGEGEPKKKAAPRKSTAPRSSRKAAKE